MADIFRKTEQGHTEIVTRANGLSFKLRRCLILIDGRRSVTDLLALLSEDELMIGLQLLESDGYIELGGTASTESAASSFTQVMDTTMDTTMDVSGRSPEELGEPADQIGYIDQQGRRRRLLPLYERRIRAAQVINELLGPVGETIAIKVEQSRNEPELEQVLRLANQYIEEIVSSTAARRFRDHVRLRQAVLADDD